MEQAESATLVMCQVYKDQVLAILATLKDRRSVSLTAEPAGGWLTVVVCLQTLVSALANGTVSVNQVAVMNTKQLREFKQVFRSLFPLLLYHWCCWLCCAGGGTG